MSSRRFLLAASLVVLSSGAILAVQPISNWPAPPTWTPPRTGSGARVIQSDIAGPLPFIPIDPCRQYDSRNFTPLATGVNRTLTLTGAPCGIPSGAVAVSVNITVFNITAAGSNGVFKVDTVSPPTIAWINYPPSETQRGNAGVVPLTAGGAIIVQAAQGSGSVDFTVDANGYYASVAANQGNTFTVINHGGPTVPAIWGETTSTSLNAIGVYGLASSTMGITDGVWGRNYSNSDYSVGVLGVSEGTAGLTFGIYGRSNSTGTFATGVYGEALGTTGRIYGVTGFEASAASNAAGVRGVDSGSPTVIGFNFATAGVRGESFNFGVLGLSQGGGVAGYHINTSGTNYDSAGFLGFSPTVGIFYTNGLTGTGTKNFVEPHPTDASKVIRYVSLEGPEAGTYFRGTDQIHRGMAVIQVPESFRLVTDSEGLTVQLTPVGAMATMCVVSQDLNQIEVRSSRDVKFHYMVNGVRKAYPHWVAIQDNEKFFVPESPSDRLPGYLSEEERGRLIRNGTYNPDGTVNMETAERVGWTKAWAEREARAKETAAEVQRNAVRR